MKRCTSCFRYSLGQPAFCAYCGRSYDVRWCSRGHRNLRTATFCGECGSADLSTAAPPASLLFRTSLWAIRGFSVLSICLIVLVVVAGLVSSLNWDQLLPHLMSLALVLGLLYWSTTILPGPVKRLGRAAGRTAGRALRARRKRQ